MTIQGPSSGSGDLGAGIYVPSNTGITIEDSVIQDNTAGVAIGDSAVTVEHNLIQDNNAPGAGSGTGVEFFTPTTQTSSVSDNHFTGNTNGDVLVAGGGTVSNVTISNNVLTNSGGIELFQASDVMASDNTASNMPGPAIYIGGGDSADTISGNSVTGVSTGNAALDIENAFGVGPSSNLTVTSNTFNVNGKGGVAVEVNDDGTAGNAYTGTLTLSGDQIDTSGSDLSILNESTTPIDATGETFNGVAAATATTAQLFAIQATVVDGVDVSGSGLVRLKAGNVYVTPNSFYAPEGTTTPSIQRGVDAASAGDTVNVEAGTYTDNVTIDKDLTLAGQGGALVSVTVQPSSGDGITISSPAANVTIENLSVTGAATAVTATGSGTMSGDTLTLDNVPLEGNATGFSALDLTTLNLSNVALRNNSTQGGSISNVATVNDTPSTGVPITITGATFQRGMDQAVNYTGVASLNVTGTSGADTFDVTPAAATTITIHGGLPMPPASPGDVLNVNLSVATNPVLNDTYSSASGYSGSWTFGNRTPIDFDGIETLTPSGPEVAVLKTNGELDLLTPGSNARCRCCRRPGPFARSAPRSTLRSTTTFSPSSRRPATRGRCGNTAPPPAGRRSRPAPSSKSAPRRTRPARPWFSAC